MVELSDLNIALIIPEPSLNLWGVYIWKEGDSMCIARAEHGICGECIYGKRATYHGRPL